MEWDETADVVVVGAGQGGLVATARAVLAGARTVTLEKADDIGGTTAKSAGGMWVPNNHHMRGAGLADPEPAALRYMARLSRPALFDGDHPTLGLPAWEYASIVAYYRHAAQAVEELARDGVLETVPLLEAPDYFSHLPECEAPNGRLLFPARGAGTSAGGKCMTEDLAEAVVRLGADIRTGHRVVDVLFERGEVVGVVAETSDGTVVRVRAVGGVIFASGGYVHDADLRTEYLAAPYWPGCAARTNTGDFVYIARRHGAHLVNMSVPWTAPIVIERSIREADTFLATFTIPGDGMLAVNRYGHRVVNEKAPYNEFTRAFFESDAHRADYPNLPLILVWDDAQAKTYGGIDRLGIPFPGAAADAYWVIQADTFEELARSIDARLVELGAFAGNARLSADFTANLDATLERFGRMASHGVDEDFARGATTYELFMAQYFGPGNGPNPTMRPFADRGPYYATILMPGAFETKGGPRTDTRARVLNNDGDVIAGLYAVGNCAASPSVEAYWSAGASLGWALCFGDLAGRDAAARAQRTIAVR
jgi:3-oxosteroid 1-dehydrogenase